MSNASLLALNSPIPKGRVNDTVGLPMPALMRIPQQGGTISALTRRASSNRVLKRGMAEEKWFEIMTGRA